MAGCPSCGRANPDGARFCNSCGAELQAAAPSREVRKVVTVLFADVVGSTALGEATDPEALRARMRSYFEDLRAIVERHGGVVEKFIGDAVSVDEGVALARKGVEGADTTDHFDVRVRARMVLADTLRRRGDSDGAAELGEAAVSIAEAKGDVAGSAWIRRRLGELGVA